MGISGPHQWRGSTLHADTVRRCPTIYANRVHAGRRLADLIGHEQLTDPVVLGLTRGGVPVAYEVAHRLNAPLDVMVARKIGAPGHRELAIGAVAPQSVVLFDEALAMLGVSQTYLHQAIRHEIDEVERRLEMIRAHHPPVTVAGRVVILVDDGIATGQTMLAAIKSVRTAGAARVIVAAPIAAADTVRRLEQVADAVVCGEVIDELIAVGIHYEDFSPVRDSEVDALLQRARAEREVHYRVGAGSP